MSHHGWISVAATNRSKALQSPFGRLFPARSHTYNSHAIALLAGALGPLQDEQDSVLHNKTKPAIPAGFTFFGQFIDHDLTEFRVVDPALGIILMNPTIEQRQRVLEDGRPTATNGRTGRLDLDSVYGLLGGPDLTLFDDKGRFEMRSSNGRPVDIVRDVDYRDGRLIADPRNDENKIIVQLHVLFERLHNALHEDAAGVDDDTRRAAVEATRIRVTNIFKRIVLYDYLPRIAEPAVVVKVGKRLVANTSLYQQMNRRVRTALGPDLDQLVDGLVPEDGEPVDATERRNEILAGLVAMPVEFAHAAFRLGHSQLRDRYQLNAAKVLQLFVTGQPPGNPPEFRDLRGNQLIDPDIEITWAEFFGAAAQNGEPLDASLPASVFRLPPPAIDAPPISLAERNIRRGVDFGLPSGQEVARSLDNIYGNVKVLTPDQVLPDAVTDQYPEVGMVDVSLAVTTPLWFYILQESSVLASSESHLGRVGSYIVAETILGSLAATKGFDLVDALDGYLQKVADAQTASKALEDDIVTMTQLLAFLGEPGF